MSDVWFVEKENHPTNFETIYDVKMSESLTLAQFLSKVLLQFANHAGKIYIVDDLDNSRTPAQDDLDHYLEYRNGRIEYAFGWNNMVTKGISEMIVRRAEAQDVGWYTVNITVELVPLDKPADNRLERICINSLIDRLRKIQAETTRNPSFGSIVCLCPDDLARVIRALTHEIEGHDDERN